MRERRRIQELSMQSPFRKLFIHNRYEVVIVVPFYKMSEFMNNEIFNTIDRLLGEFKVKPDAARFRVAAAPLGFHLFHEHSATLTSKLAPILLTAAGLGHGVAGDTNAATLARVPWH